MHEVCRLDRFRPTNTKSIVSHACEGKRGFATKQEAKNKVKQSAAHGGDRLVTYRCGTCGLWHNGHKPFNWKKGK